MLPRIVEKSILVLSIERQCCLFFELQLHHIEESFIQENAAAKCTWTVSE
jgi:hypothetical protein